MSDVRKEGPHFLTLRRIYRDGKVEGTRVLLHPAGKILRQREVERDQLEVESEKKPTKSRKPDENK